MEEQNIDPRFIEEGNYIIFPKANCRVHISWKEKFRGLNIVQARRKMKVWQPRRAQDEIIHYLKAKRIIK